MALLIVSAGALAGSNLHTVRSRTLLVALGATLCAALAGGVGLGMRIARGPAASSGTVLLDPLRPENRALIDRVGELSGRLLRLESEAASLARRVGAADTGKPQAPGPARAADNEARSASPEPSGGPLVAPEPDPNPFAARGTDLALDLSRLDGDLERIEATMQLVAQAATVRDLDKMALPTRPPIDGGRISSGFGNRLDPFTHRLARHTGLDFPAPSGAPIHASAGGRVRFAGYRSAYGNAVEIDHGNGLVTRYGHASKLYVHKGDIVLPGQLIAAVGSTGRSTGPHVHFEVIRDGSQVEPRLYLARNGT